MIHPCPVFTPTDRNKENALLAIEQLKLLAVAMARRKEYGEVWLTDALGVFAEMTDYVVEAT